jgi:hypothetical protein
LWYAAVTYPPLRPNPTAYDYTYVWTVHSLYYWWRDVGLVERKSVEAKLDLCYLNIDYPIEVALGGWVNVSAEIRAYFKNRTGDEYLVADCLSPPRAEYVFPRDL